MEGGSLGVSHPLGGSLTQGGSAAAESPIGTSASSESSGLDPSHREDLNSTYFFTHRRGSFCRPAIRDRRSSTYSWAIARNIPVRQYRESYSSIAHPYPYHPQ